MQFSYDTASFFMFEVFTPVFALCLVLAYLNFFTSILDIGLPFRNMWNQKIEVILLKLPKEI